MSEHVTTNLLALVLGRLSHDLKNPLSVVTANLRFLESAVDDEDVREAATESIFAADRMARVLEDLTQLEGWRSGSKRASFGAMDLDSLEVPLRGAFEGQLGSRSLDIALPALPPVRSDPSLLVRALINVVEHGLRRTASRGKVRVEGSIESERHFELRVLDEGPPFDPTQTPSFLLTDLPGAATPGAGFRSDQGLGLLFAGIAVRALGGTPVVETRSDGPGVLFRLRFEDVD